MHKDSHYSLFESLRDLGPYFIGEGEEVVRALFQSNLTVISLLMEERYLSRLTIPEGVKIEIASKDDLATVKECPTSSNKQYLFAPRKLPSPSDTLIHSSKIYI